MLYTWRYMTKFETETGKINEKFLLTSFARQPEPVVWRHVAYVFNRNANKIIMYLDGKVVLDSSDTIR